MSGKKKKIIRVQTIFKKKESKVDKLVKDVKQLKKAQELGYHDEFPSAAFTTANAVGNVGEIHCLSNMAVGTGDGVRDGHKVLCKSLSVIMDIDRNTASTQKLRFILFVDRQHVGVTPSATDLLESDSILAYRNKNNASRFQILIDKRLQVNDLSKSSLHYEFKKAWKTGLDQRYDGATVNDTSKNPIYMYMVSNDNTNKPAVYMYSRMRYLDN